MSMKTLFIKRSIVVLLIILMFFAGALSSLQVTSGGRSWVVAARDRVVKHIPNLPLGLRAKLLWLLGSPEAVFPTTIDTLRYKMDTVSRFKVKAQFQIAVGDFKNLYAVDRNNGDFYSISPSLNSGILPIDNIFISIRQSLGSNYKAFRINDLFYLKGTYFVSAVLLTNKQQSECGSAFSFKLDNEKIVFFRNFLITPCINDRKNPAMWAGRFTTDDSNLYFSIGEQRYDRSGFPKLSKVATEERLNQHSIFGCVLKFHLPLSSKRFEFERFSCGHRNAQGLFYSSKDRLLYESEHGPLGGDEINILQPGMNYGWPMVSLGNAYGWPLAGPESEAKKIDFDVSEKNTQYEKQLLKYGFLRGTHKGFNPPLMSWAPSVGASALIQINENADLIQWNGDLLLSTMAETALHRIRLKDKRVILDERIFIGFRIRDIAIGKAGIIYFSTDENQLIAVKLIDKNFVLK